MFLVKVGVGFNFEENLIYGERLPTKEEVLKDLQDLINMYSGIKEYEVIKAELESFDWNKLNNFGSDYYKNIGNSWIEIRKVVGRRGKYFNVV